ncbi:hypothetical protein BaRGS_00022292, partial [Batillaria attramentaria]
RADEHTQGKRRCVVKRQELLVVGDEKGKDKLLVLADCLNRTRPSSGANQMPSVTFHLTLILQAAYGAVSSGCVAHLIVSCLCRRYSAKFGTVAETPDYAEDTVLYLPSLRNEPSS